MIAPVFTEAPLATLRPSRRTFLAAALGAAAAPALPGPPLLRAAAFPRRLKLGLASYSVRKLSLDQALELCRELGIAHINLKDFHLPMTDPPEVTAATRRKIEAAGLTIMGGGTITLKNDPAQVRKAFEYAKAGGFPLMVVAPEPAAFDVIEAMIEEFDVKVAIHNHGPEDKHFPAPQDAYKLLQGRDPRFGLCMDIGHATRAGADPVKTVDECRDRLLDLHVKDLRVKTDRDSQTEVGKGVLDIPGLFRALLRTSFTGHVGLEYEINEASPQVGIKESFAYMRGVLDALEA
jgi:sugar phosphate isomerase/epimerase